MNIVLDTNILLVAISRRSQFHAIFEAFEKEQYNLCVTTDILLEYEEVFKATTSSSSPLSIYPDIVKI